MIRTQMNSNRPLNFQGERLQNRKQPQPAIGNQAGQVGSAEAAAVRVPVGLQKTYFAGLDDAKKITKDSVDLKSYETSTEALSWNEYLTKLYDNPKIARNSTQRLLDMIYSEGREPFLDKSGNQKRKERPGDISPKDKNGAPVHGQLDDDQVYEWNFFTQGNNGRVPIAGLQEDIHDLVTFLEAGALGGNISKRLLNLRGPVGTAKSTIAENLKDGLEDYSKTEEGAVYALAWKNIPEELATRPNLQLQKHPNSPDKLGYYIEEPMNSDPLYVIPESSRKLILSDLFDTLKKNHKENKDETKGLLYPLEMKGKLPPASSLIMENLQEYYTGLLREDIGNLEARVQQAEKQGDKQEAETLGERLSNAKDAQKRHKNGEGLMDLIVDKHVQANRFIFDEADRKGIGKYMPKDAKNQDSTELNGDINYQKLAIYGDPNHPLAQGYRGEFQIANRGLMEMVEAFKLQREFLYDLLSLSAEGVIKPKNGGTIPVDTTVLSHTNMEELEDKLKDEKMKALFNRMYTIEIPYLDKADDEIKIYQNSEVKKAEKLDVTFGPHVLSTASDWAIKTRKHPDITAGRQELMYGISPRLLQNAFSLAMRHSSVKEQLKKDGKATITPEIVLRHIEDEITKDQYNDKDVPVYLNLLQQSKAELKQKYISDYQKALANDDKAVVNMAKSYADAIRREANNKSSKKDIGLIAELDRKMRLEDAERENLHGRLINSMMRFDSEENRLKVLTEDKDFRRAATEHIGEGKTNQSHTLSTEDKVKALTRLKVDGKQMYDEVTAREAVRVVDGEDSYLDT